ncbi:alpha/beta fold hydrolase [Rhodopseudomonas sp. RCAM05734]|uniref:alpha/beta fold hydrolase n=1 Tax=Rhodopseudomonas sp. RCAM05734 TaxID=3457549 RepID=UPI00404396B1
MFLHAAVCDSRMWRGQFDGVSAGHKAIAYDRRGFGATHGEPEDFSAVADLMAVLDATADGKPAILVACSQGGRIALDAALRHPSQVLGLFLIAPGIAGAPEAVYPPAVADLMAGLTEAQQAGDLDCVNAIKARLFLDGPLAPEGRVGGPARRLFLDMNGIALRASPPGTDRDSEQTYSRLGEIGAPSQVIWGEFEFPHIQQRSRHIASTLPNGAGQMLAGTAHLPSLDRPADITALLTEFIGR